MAFFLPDGNPVGFKDGTLLTSKEKYYIVSNGVLREFENQSLMQEMGYSKNAFTQVKEDDLGYNAHGEMISDPQKYPDNTAFFVDDIYYQLKMASFFLL